MAIACSRCGSTDVTKASLVYEMNTFAGTGTTKGVGIGTGGIGVGVGRTQTTSHSQLAHRVAPPPPKDALLKTVLIGGIIGWAYIAYNWDPYWWVWVLLVLGWMLLLGLVGEKAGEAERGELAEYDRKWLCNRCGTLLIT